MSKWADVTPEEKSEWRKERAAAIDSIARNQRPESWAGKETMPWHGFAITWREYITRRHEIEDQADAWATGEERMDAIGTNGNDGDHYAGMCTDGSPCGTPPKPGDDAYCLGCPEYAEDSDPNEALTFGPLPSKGRAGGLKFDADKPRMELLIQGMPRALEAVGQVLTFGAEKYAAHSWKLVEDNTNRYWAAKSRHELARAKGEQRDPETGLLHLAHEACNALFLLELALMEGEQ